MHEERGVAPLRTLAERLRVPNEHAELGVLCCRLHLLAHRAFELRPETLLGVIEKLDAFRKPQRVDQFATVCEADKRGRLGLTESDYPAGRVSARRASAQPAKSRQPRSSKPACTDRRLPRRCARSGFGCLGR